MKPSYPGLRSGAVSVGAVVAVAMSVIPAFHRIGAPAVAALEQAGPSTITVLGLAASFVAAVWPPSALQPSSSVFNFMGWPTSVPPSSLMAISTPRFSSMPSAESAPDKHPIAADLDRRALRDHDHADIVGDGALRHGRPGGRNGAQHGQRQRAADRKHQIVAVFRLGSSSSLPSRLGDCRSIIRRATARRSEFIGAPRDCASSVLLPTLALVRASASVRGLGSARRRTRPTPDAQPTPKRHLGDRSIGPKQAAQATFRRPGAGKPLFARSALALAVQARQYALRPFIM